MSRNEIVKMFALYGYSDAPVIGQTPELRTQYRDGRPVTRGLEIAAWIDDQNAHSCSYACLDDDGDFLPEQPLILINPDVGLTDSDVARCLDVMAT